jgi:hypothetical protein
MDLDELFPAKPDDPLTQLTRQDLDPLSSQDRDVGELPRKRRSDLQEMNRLEGSGVIFPCLPGTLMKGRCGTTLSTSCP